MSVWSKEHNPETSLKRNVFPMSFANNLTFNLGGIYPFMCMEVMSGDTVSLDTAMGLRFMPTIWPLQNRMRADVHYFYVRNRNLYNEFKEYYTGGTLNKPMPFIQTTDSERFRTGSLMDYMNVPTVINVSEGDIITRFELLSGVSGGFFVKPRSWSNPNTIIPGFVPPSFDSDTRPYSSSNLPVVGTSPLGQNTFLAPDGVLPSTAAFSATSSSSSADANSVYIRVAGSVDSPLAYSNKTVFLSFVDTGLDYTAYRGDSGFSKDAYICPVCILCSQSQDNVLTNPADNFCAYIPCGTWQYLDTVLVGGQSTVPSSRVPFEIPDLTPYVEAFTRRNFASSLFFGYIYFFPESIHFVSVDTSQSFGLASSVSASYSLSDLPSINPFLGVKPKIPLNALPFRAYEQIYNAFFRDERNNPLMLFGSPYYDKYLPTTDGGADTTVYELHYRNWEQDFLTTCLPSPQQGEAPLVGISASGVMSLSDPETGQVYKAQAITADDADTIVGAKFIETNQDGTSIPTNVARSLVSYSTSGISINDFRNVNALQRYLETNLRRGLKYRDLVAARWGVNISYAELNMPEFIGGMTEYVNPAQVNQTSQDTSDSPLGSYAGQLYCNGSQKHKIRHFCDEEGFIIGVISVVPVPVYSQLLPKMFTKFDRLDYFQPEFGHIGMQPVPMKEVAPLQVALSGGNQDETFGYQRAWYDYLGRVDEVHGQFRGSLRDFLMYRTFNGIPRLSEDFLLVDPKPLDNVFSVRTDTDGKSIDKILGQIYIDAVVKRPIPRFGIPRLE